MFRLRKGCVLAALLASLLLGAAAAADVGQLQFVTEEFAPLNFLQDEQPTGLGPELVRELQKRTGISAPIAILPWARAYKMAQTLPNIGLINCARTAEREPLFRWVGPIANLRSAIYAKRGAGVRLASLSEAKSARSVIALREGFSAQLLQKLGFSNLYLSPNPRDAIRLMMISPPDTLMMMSTIGVPDALKRIDQKPNALEPILVVMRSQAYIAFSLDTPTSTISQFQKALTDMKRDGSFAALYKKWLPEEDPPGLEPEPDIAPPSS